MDPTIDPAFISASPRTSRPGTPLANKGSAKVSNASSTPLKDDQASSSQSAETVDLTETPVAPDAGSGAERIEQEVGAVVSQLSNWGGSLWGGLRKQSANAFDLVKKDFNRTVKEAQEELRQLQTQTVEVVAKSPAAVADTSSSSQTEAGSDPKGKGKDKSVDQAPGSSDASSSSSAAFAGGDLFSRLSSTLSSTIHEAQAHLPDNLRQLNSTTLSANFASLQKSVSETLTANPHFKDGQSFQQMREALSANIQKNLSAAGTSLNLKQAEKLAEEYMRKSEGLLHEAGEFLKDAVKVVPPEDGAVVAGLSWDGSDMYAFSTSPASKPQGDSVDQSTRSLEFTRASRKDALIRRLRTDRELLLVDPASEMESITRRKAFQDFIRDEIELKGGMAGEEMVAQIRHEESADLRDHDAFKAMKASLVPSHLDEQQFWSRYFFHKNMIELEEERRQRLLRATEQPEKEEEFSWDDAEDETEATSASAPPASTPGSHELKRQSSSTTLKGLSQSEHEQTKPSPSAAAQSEKGPSTAASRRASEDSYDIVSDQAGEAVKPVAKPSTTEDDEDSDWE